MTKMLWLQSPRPQKKDIEGEDEEEVEEVAREVEEEVMADRMP